MVLRLHWKASVLLLSVFFTGVAGAAASPPSSSTPLLEPSAGSWPTRAGSLSRRGFVPSALPLDDGRLNLKWKRFLGERIEVEMEPIVVGDLLYIGLMNGKMYALDKDTGATVWAYQAGMGITNAPTVAGVSGRLMIFFGAIDGKVYALDALTGQPAWTYTTQGPIMSTPSVYKDTVYVGSLDKAFYAFEAQTGQLKWRFDASGPISCTSAMGDEVKPGQAGIYFASGDNVAYALSEDGSLVWRQPMHGLFTKRTYAVYARGVVIFVTRKPGGEYSEPMENLPAELQGDRQPGEVVLNAWADYYIRYPERRPLYFFDAKTGADKWNPALNKTRYAPLYLPYWGEYLPVVDDQGFAWLPASGSGGDHALDHDMRLWRINLADGEYNQVAHQAQFMLRTDEVGRPTLVGTRYYQTISEDIGYYDISADQTNTDVFGNNFWNHRYPMELDEMSGQSVFGGMHKHFTRFAGSTPDGMGGANDAPSPLVVVGEEAFFTTWGHVYALTAQRPQPRLDYGGLDLTDAPSTTLTRSQAQALLREQIQAIVADGEPLQPASRFWSWHRSSDYGSFWHPGETIRSLSAALAFVEGDLQAELKGYLKKEIQDELLNPAYYEYRRACLDYERGLLDPCPDGAAIRTAWFWSNPNLVMERLYALYEYAQRSGDWTLIVDHWAFIRGRYDDLDRYWDQEAGFYLFPDWKAGPFSANLQMGGVLAVREMAQAAQDETARSAAAARFGRMTERRLYWGRYVRGLYDTGQLAREEYADPNSWGYEMGNPIPAEGYLDQDNDYRQIYMLARDDSGLQASFSDPHAVYPLRLIGYYPVLPELAPWIRDNLGDELADYLRTLEVIQPWWYMGDYSHGVVFGPMEEDSLSPLLASDIFQVKAYVLGQTFEQLAPYLPWPYEDYGYRDIFRLQNLVALLSAPDGSNPTFADVPFDHPYYAAIEALYRAGYTAGCGTDPLIYCPDRAMTRAESAVFVERGVHGADVQPTQPTQPVFADLGLESWAAKWADALWRDGYTAGCGVDPLRYCPWQGHSRAEGAVFYLRMLKGADYGPPAAEGIFADVPAGWWGEKWVEAAYAAGILPACGTDPLRACPEDPLTRGLAAYMMGQAKGLE